MRLLLMPTQGVEIYTRSSISMFKIEDITDSTAYSSFEIKVKETNGIQNVMSTKYVLEASGLRY